MDLTHLKEELSFKKGENRKLSEQVKALQDDLHDAKLELTKLHQLETAKLEVNSVKIQLEKVQEQYGSVLQELGSSEMKVASLEDQLMEVKQKDDIIVCEGLVKEREVEKLQQEIKDAEKLQIEREHQVIINSTCNYTISIRSLHIMYIHYFTES